MLSIKSVYRIGNGPSSSHTIGPVRICEYVNKEFGKGDYKVELLGSLALTGKGHLTDLAIKKVLGENTEIIFNKTFKGISHPNTMRIYRKNSKKPLVEGESLGGGNIRINGKDIDDLKDIYKENNFDEIKAFCIENKLSLHEYVLKHEPDIDDYLFCVWKVMEDAVKRGITSEGLLNKELNFYRKAKALYEDADNTHYDMVKNYRLISAYAMAVSEENAAGHMVVTAPTCGSAGVLPAALYSYKHDVGVSEKEIIKCLAVAGLIGLIIKTNASVAGAECGCQAEIGSACSMTAAALTSISTDNIEKIESAAEIGLEHNLGLTCDPIGGLVLIPCIERNAMAVIKAFNASALASAVGESHKISFDEVVKTMYETGVDMNSNYRETSISGLAKLYESKKI